MSARNSVQDHVAERTSADVRCLLREGEKLTAEQTMREVFVEMWPDPSMFHRMFDRMSHQVFVDVWPDPPPGVTGPHIVAVSILAVSEVSVQVAGLGDEQRGASVLQISSSHRMFHRTFHRMFHRMFHRTFHRMFHRTFHRMFHQVPQIGSSRLVREVAFTRQMPQDGTLHCSGIPTNSAQICAIAMTI